MRIVVNDQIQMTEFHVFVTNPASARLLEKCGFSQEGLFRQHFLEDGKPIDARRFTLLR